MTEKGIIISNKSGPIEQILGIICHLGENTSGASVSFIYDNKKKMFTIAIDDDIRNGDNVVKYAEIPIEEALEAAERDELTEPVIASIVDIWEQTNGFEPADGSPITVETHF